MAEVKLNEVLTKIDLVNRILQRKLSKSKLKTTIYNIRNQNLAESDKS